MFAKNLIVGVLGIMLVLLQSQASFAAPGAPNWLSHVSADQTIHVNNRHPNANNKNSGLKNTSPLLTISRAVRLAMLNRHKGVSTVVLIYPGIYRETVEIGLPQQKSGPPIIMRALKTQRIR
ncbi:hypothetical protein [Nitrospira sp. M1]